MAQKYLMALDYVDLHANSVLQKHAKPCDNQEFCDSQLIHVEKLAVLLGENTKRPLGDIETKHRYTPTQPVLSCRTVDIDVSGTRTYRPKSSADIITEQHALIHKIYSKARNIASAPPRRSKTPRKSVNVDNSPNKENNLKSVEIQGRPLTSHSQRPSVRTNSRTNLSNKRPKTTGQIKNIKTVHDSFMIVHADRDLIETRRSYRSLTDKIHKHWDPESHNLNTGTYQRGKKPPGVPTVDSWLTFSGSQTEESQGIVDAFADSEAADEYYNVEGSVGSRIAQQLQKGDKIRIGINGSVQSQDFKVKKWTKEDSYVRQSYDEEGKENMAKNENMIIPLSWDDQVQATQAKILTPRGPPTDKVSQNMNTTKPVVFTKLVPDHLNAEHGLSGGKKEGFRVKQRKKTKPCIDGKERDNKVTVVTIDSKSEAEELKIESLTVEEVIKKNCDNRASEKQNGRHEEIEKHSVTFSFAEPDGQVHDGLYSPSKISIVESGSSGGSEPRHPKVKPSQPTFSTKYQEVDLDIIGSLSVPNGQRPLSSESTGNPPSIYSGKSPYSPKSYQGRAGSARSSRSGLKSGRSSQQRSLGTSSLVSMTGYRPNEKEFIQIASAVKNPNPAQSRKVTEQPVQSAPSDMGRGHMTYSGIREPVPSPELELDDSKSDGPVPPMVQIKTVNKTTAQPLSISIPTAEFTDSALNSPTRAAGADSSPQVRRAKDMRDEQIDQITTLLVDAIIGPNDDTGAQS